MIGVSSEFPLVLKFKTYKIAFVKSGICLQTNVLTAKSSTGKYMKLYLLIKHIALILWNIISYAFDIVNCQPVFECTDIQAENKMYNVYEIKLENTNVNAPNYVYTYKTLFSSTPL